MKHQNNTAFDAHWSMDFLGEIYFFVDLPSEL